MGNFLTNVLLARTLAPADYGIFALIYGLLVVMNSYHTSAVVYPLSLSGAPGTVDDLHRHLRVSISSTVLFAFGLAPVVLGAAFLLGKPEITPWAIFALFGWQVQETLRRGLMAHLRHDEAVLGDTISYLGQAVGIWIYLRSGSASLKGVFFLVAVTSLLAAALQFRQLRLEMKWEVNLFGHLKESWHASRWAVLANTAVIVPGVAYPWFLALHGTDVAASYQALLNVLGVSNPVMMGIGNIALPATIRAKVSGGLKQARGIVFRYGLLGAVALIPCYAMLFVWPSFFLKLLYGPTSFYLVHLTALRLLVTAYSLCYLAYLLAVLFYGLGQSKKVVEAQATGAFASLLVGLPLVLRFGLTGAAIGLCVVYAAQVSVFLLLLARANRSQELALTAGSHHGQREYASGDLAEALPPEEVNVVSKF
jgi:O-antigen/teichoic acid export membrane protein